MQNLEVGKTIYPFFMNDEDPISPITPNSTKLPDWDWVANPMKS